MATFFYSRTVFGLTSTNVPTYFLDLDETFSAAYPNMAAADAEVYVPLAENLARRLSDVVFYHDAVTTALAHSQPFEGALLIGTYLVGFYSACKSLLDAAAIALNEIFALEIPPKQQDFSRAHYWNILRTRQPTAYHRYSALRPVVDEVVTWRDSSVHRLTPLVMVHGETVTRRNRSPGDIHRSEVEIKMVADPDVGISQVIATPEEVQWIDPQGHYEKWSPSFHTLCGYVCTDIQSILEARTNASADGHTI